MDTPGQLNAHDWYLIILDLSLDAVRPNLAAMGLNRPEDIAFTETLQPLLEPFQRKPVDERDESGFVADVFRVAQAYGTNYSRRISDWGQWIYPSLTPHQQQIFRWRSVVMRGAARPEEGPLKTPRRVQEIRDLLRGFQPILATELTAASEWDRIYCAEREELGFSPFEWLETAVRNYRFLFAWSATKKSSPSFEDSEQLYRWGLQEAALLHFPKDGLAEPEPLLTLPESLMPREKSG